MTLETVSTILAKEPHLWWGFNSELGWVVLDRQDARNDGDSRFVICCRDWVAVEISRSDFGSERYVWFKNHIGRLPVDHAEDACSQLLELRQAFESKAPGMHLSKGELDRRDWQEANNWKLAFLPSHSELLEACVGRELRYEDLLSTADWKRRRLEIVVRDGYRCRDCGIEGIGIDTHSLHVHHQYYVNGKLPWDYPDEALVTLCEKCHSNFHTSRQIIVYEDVNGKLIRRRLIPCIRCLGAGFFPQWEHIEGGICFRCNGARFDVEIIAKED